MGSEGKTTTKKKSSSQKHDQRNTNLQAAGFPRTSFGCKALIRITLGFGSQKLSCHTPNQEQSKQQSCECRIQRKLQANGCLQVILWHKDIVMATRRICIPKRALPTSHVTSTTHEAIKVSDKGKKSSKNLLLSPC